MHGSPWHWGDLQNPYCGFFSDALRDNRWKSLLDGLGEFLDVEARMRPCCPPRHTSGRHLCGEAGGLGDGEAGVVGDAQHEGWKLHRRSPAKTRSPCFRPYEASGNDGVVEEGPHEHREVDALLPASEDSDFSPLVSRLRSSASR